MKLLLRRSQRETGILSTTVKFSLHVRAELSTDEKEAIRKYKLGSVMLYERAHMTDPGAGLLGLASRIAFKMLNLTISVDDLEKGKHIECKDILEMLGAESQVREAAETFKQVLDSCRFFDGEQVLEL